MYISSLEGVAASRWWGSLPAVGEFELAIFMSKRHDHNRMATVVLSKGH